MKQIVCVSLMLVVVLALGHPAGLNAAEKQPELISELRKESYSLGYQFGGNLKSQALDIDLDVIMAGIRDAYKGNAPKLTPAEMKELVGDLKRKVWTAQQKKYQEAAYANLKEGEAFLAANAKKKEVITLPSGLQYTVLREGTGPVPKATDTVTVNYRGTLVDGTEFDSSFKRGKPSTFAVFGVIRGWTEALQHMKTGAKWRLFVPSELAYAKRQFGRIPPNSTLIFDLELLSVAQVPAGSLIDPQHAAPEPESR